MKRSTSTKNSVRRMWIAMADFEEVKKSLWHAFDVLSDSALVKKTRVKVLTNNIGHVMGVDQAETVWDKVEEDDIGFDLFVKTLRANLLVGIEKNTDPKLVTLRAELDNLCWMLCEKTYVNGIKKRGGDSVGENGGVNNNKSSKEEEEEVEKESGENKRREYSKADLFKLWKIFNFLCERSGDGIVLSPLRIDVEEADRVACEICTALGLPAPRIESRSPAGLGTHSSFLMDFCQFINHVSDLIEAEVENDVMSHGIAELHGQIISDVIRKGYMIKFGNKVTAWKDRWFVLTASALRYYVTSDEKECKGSIILCHECFTQSFPDKSGGKHHRFKLHTPNKQYELSAPDLKSKNMWMSDIKRVVGHIGCRKESLQYASWKERKQEREDRRRRTAEEEMRRCAEREVLEERERQLAELKRQRELTQIEMEERERQLQLEKENRLKEEERRKREMDELLNQKRLEIDAERQKCLDTETRLQAEREQLVRMNQEALDAERMERESMRERLKEEEAKLEEEKNALKQRLNELEEAKEMLEKAVEEERALKRDEEIVRTLQAKILEEEYAKRAELERLQDEQKKALQEEKLSRQELEEAHHMQQMELREKHSQLEALIADREEADQKWKDASDRLKQAETGRLHLEERLKLKEMTSSISLAKPLPTPNPNPFVTHRGLGAFSEADFSTSGGRQSPSASGKHSPSNCTSKCENYRDDGVDDEAESANNTTATNIIEEAKGEQQTTTTITDQNGLRLETEMLAVNGDDSCDR